MNLFCLKPELREKAILSPVPTSRHQKARRLDSSKSLSTRHPDLKVNLNLKALLRELKTQQ